MLFKPPSKKVLLAAAVVAFAVVAGVAGAAVTGKPGIRNGVITVCVEPLTKGNRQTSGDLNFIRSAIRVRGGSRGTSRGRPARTGRGARPARRVRRARKACKGGWRSG